MTDFRQILKYQLLWKSIQWETDRQAVSQTSWS